MKTLAPIRLPLFLLAAMVMVPALVVSHRAEAAKPTPPPPPPNPPVRYTIRWIDPMGRSDVDAWDMNDQGDLVGKVYDWPQDSPQINLAGYVYVASVDAVFDLNDLIPPASLADHTVIAAYGINDSGLIAGAAKNIESGVTRGFTFNYITGQYTLLPWPLDNDGVPSSSVSQLAKKVNTWGNVIAEEGGGWKSLYRWNSAEASYVLEERWQMTGSAPFVTAFNDAGQILVEDGRRYTPGIGWENFAPSYGISFSEGMNNAGTFVGQRAKPGSKQTPSSTSYSFRFTDGVDGTPDQLLDIMENIRTACDVNARGDVSIFAKRGYLYTDRDGLWALDQMVTGDPSDVTDWNSALYIRPRHIADPEPTTGYGWIGGTAYWQTTSKGWTYYCNQAFVLVPVRP